MRKFFLTASALACAVGVALLLSACKADDLGQRAAPAQPNAASQASQATTHPDGAKRITVAELQEKLKAGEVVIYDTRPKGAYDMEHIKGALLMPYSEVASRAAELPKDKLLVFYCT